MGAAEDGAAEGGHGDLRAEDSFLLSCLGTFGCFACSP